MPLTPQDVANKLFGKEFRGYAMDEVDAFLEEVESELTRLLPENTMLVSRPADATPVASAEPTPAVPSGEPRDAALRTLLMAQRTADQAIAEARAEADELLTVAKAHAAQIESEVDARTTTALGELQDKRRELETRIEDLRAFEREYRLRLKAYLEAQLKDLDVSGGGASAAGVEPEGFPEATSSEETSPEAASPEDGTPQEDPQSPTSSWRRAAPPLATETEPIGPFTAVPPPAPVEQADEGAKPPTED